jgi:Ca2+-binding RTX toxin-like protein
MNNTNDLLMQSELALASYAQLTIGAPQINELVRNTVGMSATQAEQFSETWRVVDQFTDLSSGLSATIFQARDAQGNPVGQKYLAIRGTEASGNDLAADGILALGIPGALNPQFAALKTKLDNEWLAEGGLLDGQNFTVTGHSLGGYLAAAVKQQYPQVTDAYLFNAPGVGGIFGNLADALTGALGLSGTPGGNIWNVRASEGFPFISGLGSQLGTRIDIQAEAAANPLNNHSIVTLTDALAIQAVYAKLAPSLTQSDLNALIDASGDPMALTHESALDALRTLFAGTEAMPTGINRETYYIHLKALQDDPGYKALAAAGAQITVLAGRDKETIVDLAIQDNATGLATRYALKALNPFALVGANYAAFTADGALDRYNSETGIGDLTDNYLADRANFLVRKMWFSTEDKNPVNPQMTLENATNLFERDDTYFADSASGYIIAQGPINEPTRRYLFGDERGNILSGGSVGDSLYGGSGNDVLQGNGSADWIEGGRDNDILIGGTGDDVLLGGKGLDTYLWNTGDGDDRLMDTDFRGRILINGNGIGGLIKQTSTTWTSPDNKVTLTQGDTWKLSIDGGGSIDLGTSFTDGDYGIYRSELAPGGTIIRGDRKPIDHDITTPEENLEYDSLGNVIASTTEAPGREDRLYGSESADTLLGLEGNDIINGRGDNDLIEGGTGSDILIGDAGSDTIYGLSGPAGGTPLATALSSGETDTTQDTRGDWIDGQSGNDILVGSAANDLLSGGTDNDLLIGGAGNDLLLGDVALQQGFADWSVTRSVENNVYTYRINQGTITENEATGGADVLYGGKGQDWLLAGAGDDLLDGGSEADALFGQAGNDTLLGGTGDDMINGDSASLAENLQGSDWIDGGDGADRLWGMAGDDVIIGGKGNDTIYGGKGRDTYIYNKGDGVDTIFDDDTGPEKSIVIFGAGVGKGDFKLRKGSLLLDFGNGDALHIENFDAVNPLSNASVEAFQFADGTSLGWDELLARGFDLDGTEGDDEIIGTGVADRIDGKAGNDTIWGLDGNDVIIGGTGIDAMDGGLGDDLYIVRAGDAALPADGVIDNIEGIADSGGSDTLRLEGRSRADVRFEVDDTGTTLIVQAGSDQLGIVDQDQGTIDYIEFGSGEAAERVAVGDLEIIGRTATDTQADAVLAGTFGNDRLTVTGSNATLSGGRGDDLLVAMGDHAMLTGGRGNDILTASGTNTTIRYAVSDGTDQVSLGSGMGNILKLSGVTAADLALGLGAQGELALQVGSAAGDMITFTGFDRNKALAASPFDHIAFDDTSTLSYADLLARGFDFAGTAGNDILTGTSVVDRIDGGAGDDLLIGGSGADTLTGGAGADVYQLRYGDGTDTVIDGGAETNTLRFESWQTERDIRTARAGDDLQLIVKGTADGFTLKDYYAGAGSSWQVDFGGANPVTLDSVLASQDGQALAIDALWSERKSAAINGAMWNANQNGWTYVGNLTYEAPWLEQVTTLTARQTDTTTYSTIPQYDYLPRKFLSSETTETTATTVQNWGSPDLRREFHHFDVSQIQSDATLIQSTGDYHGEETYRSGIAMLDSGQTNFMEHRWLASSSAIVGSYRDGAYGNTLVLAQFVSTMDTYAQSGRSVTGFSDGLSNWTAPANTVIGNRVAVSYQQLDFYLPAITEIVAGASDNEIRAYSGGWAAFVDGGLGNDTIYGTAGGLLYGNAGDDVIYGNGSILIGGDGSDTLHGGDLADRYVSLSADETGTDIIEDGYGNVDEFKSWYYETQGINNYLEREGYPGEWILWQGEGFRVNSREEAEAWFAEPRHQNLSMADLLASGELIYVPPGLPPALLGDSKDFRLVESLIGAGRIQPDIVVLPAGIEIENVTLGWGAVVDGNGITRTTLNLNWNGTERLQIVMPRADDPIGWGVERVQFAHGSLGLGDLVALAPPMPDRGDGTQVGNRQDNILIARDSGEHLFGLGGNDSLTGGSGSDVLDGGAGNDSQRGGQGNDVYVFGRGDGQDLILDHDATTGNIDTVFFAPGITPDQVSARREGTNLVLTINNSSDRLTVSRWFEDASHKIEQVSFFDGTNWDANALLAMAANGPAILGDDNDTFVGSGSADVIEGRGGDDTLHGQVGDDFIKGGSGNDVLSGGVGNDVYYFARGDGWDVVDQGDAAQDDFDIVRFGEGIAPDDIVFSKSGIGNDLVLTLANSTDSVTLRDGLGWDSTMLSAVEFVDGTVWDRDTLMSKAYAPSDDVLTGTVDDDYMQGGLGRDVYLIGPDGGYDVVYERVGGPMSIPADEADTIRFMTGINPGDVTVVTGTGEGEGEGLLRLSIHDGASAVDLMFWPETLPRIEFADGTVWSPGELQAALDGNISGNEYFQKMIGSNDDETLEADTDAYSEIHGMAGNDTLIAGAGGGLLIGGVGNDTLLGGSGSNGYFIDRHSGNDTVIVSVGSENFLELGSDIAQDQVRFARHTGEEGRDLTVYIDGSDTTATIKGWYDAANPSRVDSFYFWATENEVFGEELDAAILADNPTTGTVALAGEAAQNQTLAAASTLTDLDGLVGLGYQWQSSIDGSSWSDIDGAIAGSFSLTEAEVGRQVRVVASYADREGKIGSVASAATPAIANVNDAPMVNIAIAAQSARENDAFAFELPAATFADADAGDSLALSARLANGDPLPAWLSFDAATGRLIGTPAHADAGELQIVVTATDLAGAAVSQTFALTVEVLAGLTLTGTAGNDILTGGIGNDTLDGGAGRDRMIGGAGNDIYVVDTTGEVIVELTGEGTDTVQSGVSLTLAANVENLTLLGTATISGTGNAMDNLLTGNSGNNTLNGGAGADTLIGGLGNDSYYVDSAGDIVTEALDEGTDRVIASISYTLGKNLENLTLTGTEAIDGTGNAQNNVIVGNSAGNVLSGLGGNDSLSGGIGSDTLFGGEGNDTLNGSAGDDSMTGGLGNDSYYVDNAGDVVTEALDEGTDRVIASISYTLGEHLENLTLTGTEAIDGTGNELNNVIVGNSAGNVLRGLGGNDSLSGGIGSDTLFGGEGNDTLNGSAGDDSMTGGLGNDSYYVDSAGDVVTEALDEGTDRVIASISYTLGEHLENLTLTGAVAIDGTGNELNNVIVGNVAGNVLSGLAGNDSLSGGIGSDTLFGGEGNDTLNGSAGDDSMTGGLGNDSYYVDSAGDVVTEAIDEGTDRVIASISYTLGEHLENLTLTGTEAIDGTGNELNNAIVGNSVGNVLSGLGGNDSLSGSVGDDTLDGGAGNDRMTGGQGNDTYRLGLGSGADIVVENDATAGNTDVAEFLAGITADQIWLRHVGNSLEARIIGTTDSLTVQNWYLGDQYHVEQFRTADGKLLLDSQVENLVQAMAAFAPPAAGQTTLPPAYQDTLAPVIAANWQ